MLALKAYMEKAKTKSSKKFSPVVIEVGISAIPV